MNRVVLVGRLTRDPEMRTTSSGISQTRFTIAVNRRTAGQNGQREADFINCVAWRGTAVTIAKYLKKGREIAVEGRLQTGSYDAQDGTKRYTTDVVADEVEFISSTRNGGEDEGMTFGAAPASRPEKKETAELQEIDDDSLPF